MPKFVTAEVWLCVDANGEYAIGLEDELAKESYAENIGDLSEQNGFRLVKVVVKVPLPEVSVVELEAEVPALKEAEKA